MATDGSSAPVNGNYGAHEQNGGYGSVNANSQTNYNSTTPSSTGPASSVNPTSDLSKDEVGWYFVEQYYTTLSRSPEKLYVSRHSSTERKSC